MCFGIIIKPARVECVAQLDQAGRLCSDKLMDCVDVNVDMSALSSRVKEFVKSKGERRLRVAT